MKKIAVIRRNGLGDLLCAWPLVLYLKRRGEHVTLFASESNAPLVPFLSPVDELAILPSSGNKYISHFRFGLRYRKKFDVAISAKPSPMKLMNFFLFCLGAKQRVAFVRQKWHRLFINQPLIFSSKDSKGVHQALKCLQTVAPELKEVPVELYPTLHVSDDLKKKYGLSLQGPVFLVNASTSRQASRFHDKRYASLLNRLYKEFPFTVLITGLKKDSRRAKNIQNFLKTPSHLHFPRNFEDFMVTLDTADFFFVPDGGVAHIGAALKKKGVVLYGETNPVEWAPLSKEMKTFFHPVHVDHLLDETIFEALKEVICARDNLRSST